MKKRTVARDRDTFGKRLRQAIEQLPRAGRQKGLRHFQRLMADRAKTLKSKGVQLDGCALSSIQGYLQDRREPTIGFVREAAKVLDVDVAWLIEGGPQPGVATLVLAGPAIETWRRVEEAFERGAETELPLRVFRFGEREPALLALSSTLNRCRVWRPTTAEPTLAEQIGRAIVAPLRALGIDVEQLSPAFIEDHIIAMAPILWRALEEEHDAEEA